MADVVEGVGEVAVREEAREDGRKLTPANQNPWYVLMTLYGEHEGDSINWEKHEKNKEAWNILMVPPPSHSTAEKIAEITGCRMPENVNSLRSSVVNKFKEVWAARNPGLPPADFPKTVDTVNLGDAKFEKVVSLDGFIFNTTVVLSGSDFSQSLNATKVYFGGELYLYDCHFYRDLIANQTHFSRWVSAWRLFVGGCFIADKSNFLGGASFTEASIDFLALEDAKATGVLSFERSCIGDELVLEGLQVDGHLACNGLILECPSVWVGLRVSEGASFVEATFNGSADFSNSVFQGEANFAKSRFTKSISFGGAIFAHRARFEEAVFGGLPTDGPRCLVNLRDARFQAPTSFARAQFSSNWPQLSGATLDPVTIFTTRTEDWPKPFNGDLVEIRKDIATIRHAVSKQGLPEDEHFFYRREMRCTARTGGGRRRVMFWLFETLSYYGHSIFRPTFALAGLWAIGFAMLWGYFASQSLATPLYTAAGLSFSNLFPAFGFTRLYFEGEFIRALPIPLKAWAAFQTVASLPLLFFLGLGLRNRFRLR